ncbi:hypothetical protein [Hydrocarboniphaga effusa]|jgi:hypothetical protein|uniref:hypothetical protein n=1 Tax=Hydrocarboniphaga effusa TaxID=243629 RepID=UPI003BAB9A2E
MKPYAALIVPFAIFGCVQSATSPLRIEVLSAVYTVEGKQVSTAKELDALVAREKATEARVVVQPDSSYEQVAEALRVLQKHNISIGLAGNVQSK